MIRFLDSDKKNRSRLPNDNFVAVQFDDDAVFDAVTHRKNANSRTGPGYGLGLATLTDAPTRKGNKGRELQILLLDSAGRKKIRKSKSLDNGAHLIFAPKAIRGLAVDNEGFSGV